MTQLRGPNPISAAKSRNNCLAVAAISCVRAAAPKEETPAQTRLVRLLGVQRVGWRPPSAECYSSRRTQFRIRLGWPKAGNLPRYSPPMSSALAG